MESWRGPQFCQSCLVIGGWVAPACSSATDFPCSGILYSSPASIIYNFYEYKSRRLPKILFPKPMSAGPPCDPANRSRAISFSPVYWMNKPRALML